MNLIKNRQNHPKLAHSASLGRFEGPFSPTMNLIKQLVTRTYFARQIVQQEERLYSNFSDKLHS